MKFVPVSIERIDSRKRSKKKVMKMVEEFWESDSQAVRVEFNENEYKSIASAQSTFRKAAKALNIGVFAMTRNGVLYLVKEKI